MPNKCFASWALPNWTRPPRRRDKNRSCPTPRRRVIPHTQFYPSQGLDACLDCLRQAVAARGLPTRLYMDNAKMYCGLQLARIAASIGILIVHTPPHQPEGRGKIERHFRSLRQQFLANLDPKLTLSLEASNQRLWIWIDTVYHRSYHRSPHSALETTPLLRWQRDIEQHPAAPARPPPICAACSFIGSTDLLREPQRDTSLGVVHFHWNFLKPQLFDVPRGCSRNIHHSDVEGIGNDQQRHR